MGVVTRCRARRHSPPSPEVAEMEELHRAERVPELVADLIERLVPIPAMLVVEDAHLADPASEVVLTAVARRTERHPWLLLVTRDDRPGGWVPTDARRIELGPLDMASSRAGRDGHAGTAIAARGRRGAGRPLGWSSAAVA